MFNLNYITMKKNTLLIGVFMLLGASPALAQDLVIPTMADNENIELVQDAKFNVGYGNVGDTNPLTTIIGLGEVDFGADGNAYQATGVEFALGWGEYNIKRYVVLKAGDTFETAEVFNEIVVDRTFGYHDFETFITNMSEDFERPTGKQKVWLTFREGNGNLRSVIFYKNKVENEGQQLLPNDAPDYNDNATIIPAIELVRAIEAEDPEKDPYKDAKYDEKNSCWGGITSGFIVRTENEIDFGNGEFQQLVAYIGHDGERYREYMEFYIDEVKPENMIARTWSGINLQKWNDFTPIATKLKEVKGSHHLFVKWDAATNLHRIDLLKESVWFENPDCGVVYENVQPSENAVVYVTKGDIEAAQGGDPNEYEWQVLVRNPKDKDPGARCEGSNIGYTSNGVVVAYYGVDFKDGEYKRVIINHSCDKNWLGTIEESNFSLYLDLDDLEYWDRNSNDQNPEELTKALADYEPIAVVRAQGTGDWNIKEATAAPLKEVTGVHNMYVAYNVPSGCNIYGIYLDPDAGDVTGIKPATTIEGLEIYSGDGGIIVNAAETVNIAIYTTNGMLVTNKTLNAGTTPINNLPAGLYILKASNKAGIASTGKLMVK